MKYYFGDNQEYGAEDIRDAFSTLVAAGGVSPGLENGKESDVSALNSLIGGAIAAGVVPDGDNSLKLTLSGGAYSVSPGRAIFSNGGIAIVEEKREVDVHPGQYLYISCGDFADSVFFTASDAERTDGAGVYHVPLGYVKSDGSVENRRVYARGKVPALASASWSSLREQELIIDTSSLGTVGGYVEVKHEFDGEMNFMLIEARSQIGLMYIEEPVRYFTVHRQTSTENGVYHDSIGVDWQEEMEIRGTLVEHGNGYIKMRYKVDGNYHKRTVVIKALIGLKK